MVSCRVSVPPPPPHGIPPPHPPMVKPEILVRVELLSQKCQQSQGWAPRTGDPRECCDDSSYATSWRVQCGDTLLEGPRFRSALCPAADTQP